MLMPLVKILGDLTIVPVKLDLLVMGNLALVRVYTLCQAVYSVLVS